MTEIDVNQVEITGPVRTGAKIEVGTADPNLKPLMVSTDIAASLLGISPRTLAKLNCTEQTPRPVRIGTRVLWRIAELEDWVAAGCPPRNWWEAHQEFPKPNTGRATRGRRGP